MASDVELNQVLNEIPVVKEYPDVFPDIIPVFPLAMEVEFSIDLVPKIGIYNTLEDVPNRVSRVKEPVKRVEEKEALS